MNRKHGCGYYGKFFAKVNKTDSCWLWTGAKWQDKTKRRLGYGKAYSCGKIRKAHRVSWEISNGNIPDGLCVLHKCDVPLCVNPEHLFLGTVVDNVKDMVSKNRNRWGQGIHTHQARSRPKI